MIGLKLFTVFTLCLFHQSGALNWPTFKVKYSTLDVFRLNSFFTIPRTVQEAFDDGYERPPERQADNRTQPLCMKDDPRICVLYDAKDTIAGYQIAIPVSAAVPEMKIDYNAKGFESVTLFGEDLYATKIFFVPQETLTAGGRDFDGQTGTGLWINIGGKLTEIPRKEADIAEKIPEFKKQNCFKGMGVHYFYNVSKDLTVEDYQPWFVLYSNEGDLQGFGLVIFGKNHVSKSFWSRLPFVGDRDWFEFLPAMAVRKICPACPDWISDYIDEHGPFSHHMYFIEQPWKISC